MLNGRSKQKGARKLEDRPPDARQCNESQIRSGYPLVLAPNVLLTDGFHQTTIFGVKYPVPIFVAPVGVQGILHTDGELASARAAGNVGVPYIMSTASSRSMEDVAAANGPNGQRWYQLYW